jgi:hypothetical protein
MLVTPGTRNCPQGLGSGSFLIIETRRVLQRLGPDLGLGAGVASGSWDPTSCPSLGTSACCRSWNPDPLVVAPSDVSGGSGSCRSMTSTMLIESIIAEM